MHFSFLSEAFWEWNMQTLKWLTQTWSEADVQRVLLQSHSETIWEGSLLAQYPGTPVDEFSSTVFPMCLILSLSLDCKSDQALLKELPNILLRQAWGQIRTYSYAQTRKDTVIRNCVRMGSRKLHGNCLNSALFSWGVIWSRLWTIMDVIQERLGGFHLLLSISLPGAAKLNNKFTPTV